MGQTLPKGALCAALSLLAACGGTASREADRPYMAGLAEVTAVAAEVSVAGEPRVVLRVEGRLPDRCTQLESPRTDQLGARFEVTLATRRPFGATCPPEPTPFATSIRLRPVIFETGAYVATVNGVSADFAVLVDPAESELYRPDLFD